MRSILRVYTLILYIIYYIPCKYALIPSPRLVEPTNSSLFVEFSEYANTGSVVFSYDIEYKSLYNNEWKSLGGVEFKNVAVSQVVSVRVDEDKEITSGTFQLAMNRRGLVQSDILESTRTELIKFNAASAEMLDSLNKLSNVKIKEVKRCDEFQLNVDSYIGHGGSDFWSYGCPFGSRGGYRWLIVFDIGLADAFVPELIVTKSYLGNTWSGPGNQITVSPRITGAISPSICTNGLCKLPITGLAEGTPYTARYRAFTYQIGSGIPSFSRTKDNLENSNEQLLGFKSDKLSISSMITDIKPNDHDMNGWSPYSQIAEYVFTLENKPPTRPSPPEYLSSTDSSISITIKPPPPSQSVRSIEIEYRSNSAIDGVWQKSDSVNLLLKNSVTANIYNLSEVNYVFRVRFLNDKGYSPWSLTSSVFSTKSKLSVKKIRDLELLSPEYLAQNKFFDSHSKSFTIDDFRPSQPVIVSIGSFTAELGILPIYRIPDSVSPQYNMQYRPCLSEEFISTSRIVVFETKSKELDSGSTNYKTIILDNLNPQTEYEARIILILNSERLVLGDVIKFTTLELNRANEKKLSSIPREKIIPSHIQPPRSVSGNGSEPGNINDPYYMVGTGSGGVNGRPGANGHCVIIGYNPNDQQPYKLQSFFFSGNIQTLHLPQLQGNAITYATFKCWGAGGGSPIPSGITNPVSGIASGGGGGYAEVSVKIEYDDAFEVIVGGGGASGTINVDDLAYGKGGFNGGGDGGYGYHGSAGGGGGASVIRMNGEILLVAAGGGGGGFSDYCCAYGGSGGGEVGSDGSYPGPNTPWPLASLEHPTPVMRRYEFTSSQCPQGLEGEYCISMWDILPESLPSGHRHLQYGAHPSANYSSWSMPGSGGSKTSGGKPGNSGSFVVKSAGSSFTTISGITAIFSQFRGILTYSQPGRLLHGGNGASGFRGGGGGGGGYFGGGGGGSGIDGAGGGGGCSYVNESLTQSNALSFDLIGFTINNISVDLVSDIKAHFSWSADWSLNAWGPAYIFEIEIAIGSQSLDFVFFDSVKASSTLNSIIYFEKANYTAIGLKPDTTYQFRIIPIFTRGRGRPSTPIKVTTIASPTNYWTEVVPVPAAPYLDDTGDDRQRLPSARRGHSLSLINDMVYMFGGRTDGVSCASVLKDVLYKGSPESGIHVYPCVSYSLEVQELWRLYLPTLEWLSLRPAPGPVPPPREQHNAIVGNNGDRLFIFGGRKRGNIQSGRVNELAPSIVYDDLYVLDLNISLTLYASWVSEEYFEQELGTTINQDRETYLSIDVNSSERNSRYSLGEGVFAKSGMCIDSLRVKVEFQHPCLYQLRFTLAGPAPTTISQTYHAPTSAYEVILFNQRSQNRFDECLAGRHDFAFSDNSKLQTDSCCINDFKNRTSVTFQPEGKLAHYIGASPVGQWTLIVEDVKDDSLIGSVISWDIEFSLSACSVQESGSWSNITDYSQSDWPPARYGAMTISFDKYFFLFGGRDSRDRWLDDLFRYNTKTQKWTMMQPTRFNIPLTTASNVGSNFMMTPWGLLRFGGYYRQPMYTAYSKSGTSPRGYVSEVFILDPVTLRWTFLKTTDTAGPEGRYLAGAVYIPSKLTSSYNSTVFSADTVFIVGGSNGASGIQFDGTSGGLLSDSWILKLAGISDYDLLERQRSNIASVCRWRDPLARNSSVMPLIESDCLGQQKSLKCELRDILLLNWCSFSISYSLD